MVLISPVLGKCECLALPEIKRISLFLPCDSFYWSNLICICVPYQSWSGTTNSPHRILAILHTLSAWWKWISGGAEGWHHSGRNHQKWPMGLQNIFQNPLLEPTAHVWDIQRKFENDWMVTESTAWNFSYCGKVWHLVSCFFFIPHYKKKKTSS